MLLKRRIVAIGRSIGVVFHHVEWICFVCEEVPNTQHDSGERLLEWSLERYIFELHRSVLP